MEELQKLVLDSGNVTMTVLAMLQNESSDKLTSWTESIARVLTSGVSELEVEPGEGTGKEQERWIRQVHQVQSLASLSHNLKEK